jgi:predicted RNA-binding Zn-ribbon protein involved in translation (DUF1610 family)
MLEQITYTKCPKCGSEIIAQSKSHQHINGSWNEYMEFYCGYKLHYSPNFKKIIEDKECNRSEEYKEKIKKREDAYIKLHNYIDKLEVDQEYKDKIKKSLKYV